MLTNCAIVAIDQGAMFIFMGAMAALVIMLLIVLARRH